MAEALIRGVVASGSDPKSICVSDPMAARRRLLARRYKVRVSASNRLAVRDASLVLLAVKPQIMNQALADIHGSLAPSQLVVSIAAGVRIERLEKALGEAVRVVRVMPNTPCLVGRGASVICGGRRARPTDRRKVERLLATVGRTFVVREETQMDAVTGLSGSGPAYVYLFAEALLRGGTRCGLDEELARQLAFETIAGAAEMLLQTRRSPAELRTAVSSPGGTTLAGLAQLERGGFARVVTNAVSAATRRSRELGRGAS